MSAFSGRRRRRTTVLTSVLALLLVACTDASEPSDTSGAGPSAGGLPQRGGAVTFGVIGEPATLDPYSPEASDLTYALLRPVYPSLFRLLPTGEARPSLALSLDETGGGARVRIRDARWSNGRPITAQDVVDSIKRARPPSGFARIDSARAVDRRTVVLRGPVANWAQTLATAALIVPREGLRVSGGPYRVSSRTPGLEIVYARNTRWWGRPALLGRVTVQFTANIDIILGLLRRGHFDAAAPTSTLGLQGRLESARLRTSSALGWESIFLDFSRSDLPRPERVGVARALDRAHLVDVFVSRDGRASYALNPGPGPEGVAGPWARRWGPSQSTDQVVEIAAPRDDELLALLQEAIYEQLRRAGIAAELTSIEGTEYYGGWLEREPVDIALLRSAGAPGRPGGSADFADFDALPLAHVESVVTWRPEVGGLTPNPTFEGPLWNLERWHETGAGQGG